ncbi:MAG TPA: TIGR01777 family oxidoreductase [Candidatus Melainabacteria bacterium]|nr:TIGR01777 family oxidoreductase [Candidatus Melainabacteria bacterium]
MKIAITGASGLVGKKVTARLEAAGHQVVKLVRRVRNSDNEFTWNPETDKIDAKAFEGVDSVIHLAGENIASKRWSSEQKMKIKQSRVNGTKLIAGALATLDNPPRALVSASAIGFYGDRGAEMLTEESKSGSGFLAHVCRDWEDATRVAESKGLRVVHARLGVVLSKEGGALKMMLPPFLMGAGGPLGNGKQYMSWIDLDDAAKAFIYLATESNLSGPVNLVAPNPETNADFTKKLAKVIHRPAFFPVPEFGVKTLFGEMGQELLLASNRVSATKLVNSGFKFDYPELESALKHELN